MSTQSVQPSWRPALTAPFIALALAVALLVLGAQASLLWGSRTSVPVRPGSTMFLPASSGASGPVPHIPAGCRPKFGC
jgi:hypothetical protein